MAWFANGNLILGGEMGKMCLRFEIDCVKWSWTLGGIPSVLYTCDYSLYRFVSLSTNNSNSYSTEWFAHYIESRYSVVMQLASSMILEATSMISDFRERGDFQSIPKKLHRESTSVWLNAHTPKIIRVQMTHCGYPVWEWLRHLWQVQVKVRYW